jgi:hypothetical protein
MGKANIIVVWFLTSLVQLKSKTVMKNEC